MSRLTKKQRNDYLLRHPLCVKCGEKATQVHHVKMIQDGGGNEEPNLPALCYQCHQDTDDHAKCVGRMEFVMDEDGNVTLKDDGEGPV